MSPHLKVAPQQLAARRPHRQMHDQSPVGAEVAGEGGALVGGNVVEATIGVDSQLNRIARERVLEALARLQVTDDRLARLQRGNAWERELARGLVDAICRSGCTP